MEAEREMHPDVDPGESPFAVPPIAGLPFEKGGEEDRAIDAIIREAERDRATRSAAAERSSSA